MSDPLSVSASIAGLIGISKEVVTIIANYVSAVKSAPENVRCLQNELTALNFVLDEMRNLLREEELLGTSFDRTSVLISAVDVASFQIKDLYTKLDKFRIPKNNKAAEFFERMKWPLRADECEKAVVQIQRLAQCLHFSLNISNRSFLGKKLAELEKKHNELQTTMSTLQKISFAVPQEISRQSEELSKMMTILTEISTTSAEISKISTAVNELQRKCKEGELNELLSWISPINPYERHDDILSKRHEGTGQWFIEMSAFQGWVGNGKGKGKGDDSSNHGRVYACYGKQGAGKSVICSTVIDYLSRILKNQSEKSCVIWLYCDYQKEAQQTPEKLIGALLRQVLRTVPDDFKDVIEELQKLKKENRFLDFNSVFRFLTDALRRFDNLYVCIDALDECQEHRVLFLRSLNDLLQTRKLSGRFTRVFLTGREHVDQYINNHLTGPSMCTIKLEANKEDIAKYLEHQIELDDNGSGTKMDSKFVKEIVDSIIATSDGMFLLPALQIRHVLEQTTTRARREALETMPKKLDEAFQNTLRRIENQPASRGTQGMDTLKWIFLSEEPLTLDELSHALSIKPGDTYLDEDGFPSPKSILDCCLGLVVIDEATSLPRLVHKSLQDFFQKQYAMGELFPRGQEEIASTCLTFMGFDSERHKEPSKRVLRLYVTENWGHHARKSLSNFDGWHNPALLLKTKSSVCYGYLPWYYSRGFQNDTTESIIFHIPVYFGLTGLVEYMLENWTIEIDVEVAGYYYGYYTPLYRAIERGNEDIVRLLIENDADIEKKSLRADIKTRDIHGWSSLRHAGGYGHTEVARLLLEQGADIDDKDNDGRTLLSLAAGTGNKELMRLLLEGGADTGARDNDGWSSLHYAARYGHAEDEVLLLKERARMEAEKPLHRRRRRRRCRFPGLDLLDFPGFSGRGSHSISSSYLDGPAINEATAIMQMLLEKGADIEARDNNGFSPLCQAARDGKVGMVQLLLEKGADPECQCNCGRTPLAWAARMENEGVVQLLLEKCANPSSKDKDWSTGCCYKESELHRC
ncbi:hypothetical protein BZA77DRAFT_344514 [Pyronema omphalodes]|nr:hypothetical protein BZA77DRAFT_344514 [Pyronema omphalodes]